MGYQILIFLAVLVIAKTSAKIIDLTHVHASDTLMSPNMPHYNRSTLYAGPYLPGVYAEGGAYFSGEHGGTHMDAPVHFQKGGQKIDEIPITNTIAEGVMIDCSSEAAQNRTYQVTHEKILAWEEKHDKIPKHSAVLFNFGWSNYFHNRIKYLGGDGKNQFTFEFPTVSKEAAFWLYTHRYPLIIGTDTLSPDPFKLDGKNVTSLPIHQKYLPDKRLIVENLNALEKLPARGFRFHASPVKYKGATGTQIRAYAMTFDEDDKYLNSAGHKYGLSCLSILFIFSFVTSFLY